MGCTIAHGAVEGGGAANKPSTLAGDDFPPFTSSSQGVLLDYYTLGPVLGQGAFGVVYQCTKKNETGEYAVKMIDKVESSLDEIAREADMMHALDHPNIVKLHQVFTEKCFVCIVMDRYRGGDLIVGMQKHWKTKGKIAAEGAVHIMKQMVASVEYIHIKNIVHRDIKGDNYLMDRENLVERDCKIFLSDFGTAAPIKNGERLKKSVGTRTYWAPEFFNKDYGSKVDVWAIGVVIYGLLDGRFPFKGEPDVRYKKVVLPNRIPSLCKSFVLEMLKKEEEKRPSAAEVLLHKWLETKGIEGVEKDEKNEVFEGDQMREGGPNEGIQERRQELVERLQNKEGRSSQAVNIWNQKFDVLDKRTNWKHTFEWWSEEKVEKAGLLKFEGPKQASTGAAGEPGQNQSNVFIMGQMLRDHNIDTGLFGKGEAKTLEKFAAEVNSGAARLMLDATEHKKLVRVVDIVLLRLSFGSDKKKVYLIESGEKYHDGRKRPDLYRLPGTKKEPFENTKRTAQRILAEMLNMIDCKVSFDFLKKEVYEDEDLSPSYPGVRTVYRKEIVAGEVSSVADEAVLQRIGLKDLMTQPERGSASPSRGAWSFEDSKRNTKFFTWMSEKQCQQIKVNLRAPTNCDEVSGLVQAPIGYDEETLKKFLADNGIDPSKFGDGQTRTLKEFSTELIKGESSLMKETNGTVLRTVDIVLLKLTKAGTNELLVETGEVRPEGTIIRNRLPGSKRRPDENQFVTARRILRRQLMVSENNVNLHAKDVQIIEEQKDSPSYPGLTTVYRKRLIKGEIAKNDGAG